MKVLDARNLLCPMPVIRLQNFVLKSSKGEMIQVRCTDPGTKSDIPTWCRMNDHRVVSMEELGFEIHFTIEV